METGSARPAITLSGVELARHGRDHPHAVAARLGLVVVVRGGAGRRAGHIVHEPVAIIVPAIPGDLAPIDIEVVPHGGAHSRIVDPRIDHGDDDLSSHGSLALTSVKDVGTWPTSGFRMVGGSYHWPYRMRDMGDPMHRAMPGELESLKSGEERRLRGGSRGAEIGVPARKGGVGSIHSWGSGPPRDVRIHHLVTRGAWSSAPSGVPPIGRILPNWSIPHSPFSPPMPACGSWIAVRGGRLVA